MLVLFLFFNFFLFLHYLCYKRIQQMQAKMSPAWPLTAWGGADNTAQQGRAASACGKCQAPPPRTEPILLRRVQTPTDSMRRRIWNALCCEHSHSLRLSVLTLSRSLHRIWQESSHHVSLGNLLFYYSFCHIILMKRWGFPLDPWQWPSGAQ